MIFVIADLHLSFATPNKEMDVFGSQWNKHDDKIASDWKNKVSNDDLVLLPGDISWASSIEGALADLKWIDQLPGKKVMIRGNHDYWWSSPSKVRKALPESIEIIQNSIFQWGDIEIGGARLWDSPEFSFGEGRDYSDEDRKIFERELNRLELSLKQFSSNCSKRVAMTHYPPIGADLKPTRAHILMKEYGVKVCVFGHLHKIEPTSLPFGQLDGVRYTLTSCDYMDFKLLQL